MLILLMSYSKGDLNTQGNGLLSNRKIGYAEKIVRENRRHFRDAFTVFPAK